MAMLWWAGILSSLVLAPPSLYVLARDGFSPRAVPFVVATVIVHSMYFFALGKASIGSSLSARIWPNDLHGRGDERTVAELDRLAEKFRTIMANAAQRG